MLLYKNVFCTYAVVFHRDGQHYCVRDRSCHYCEPFSKTDSFPQFIMFIVFPLSLPGLARASSVLPRGMIIP